MGAAQDYQKILLSPESNMRLTQQLQTEIENPKSRKLQPTFKGFLSEQMSPGKGAIDNQPTTVGSVTRVPGQIGWGIERKHLRNQVKVLTDDTRFAQYPVQKGHLGELDSNRTMKFTRMEGDRAQTIDKKLGIDYHLYNALNMQAQRAVLKTMDAQQKINSTIPNRASGLGKVDAMNKKLHTERSGSYLAEHKVSIPPITIQSLRQKHYDFNLTFVCFDQAPSPKVWNTRQSFGISTSATDSKSAFKIAGGNTAMQSVDRGQNHRQKSQFEFSKLVTSIMSNPFTSASGLNAQNQSLAARATQRPGA